MKLFYFRLNITYQSFEQTYRVPNTIVRVRDESGQMLQIPALRFTPFFSQLGIRGRFELTLDDNNKLLNLIQISE
ncbi:MAG: DUF2835 family protein [Psychromonas sp.]|nr:DUF2835 family protein [Psychromonas sp.]